jgi:hypothetical protein
MLIEDRARSLRKAIPSAISELAANQMEHPNSFGSYTQREKDRLLALMAAREFMLLADALAAAARAALQVLDPPLRPKYPPAPPPIKMEGWDGVVRHGPRPNRPISGSAAAKADAE